MMHDDGWKAQGVMMTPPGLLPVGALVPLWHQVWRVMSVRPKPQVDWTEQERQQRDSERRLPMLLEVPHRMVLRPAEQDPDVTASTHDLHLSVNAKYALECYPGEHYPICARCHEPLPCREKIANDQVAAAMRKIERYSFPGVCPACEKPVTRREWAGTYEINRVVPGGPPVTFHLRKECADELNRFLATPVPNDIVS